MPEHMAGASPVGHGLDFARHIDHDVRDPDVERSVRDVVDEGVGDVVTGRNCGIILECVIRSVRRNIEEGRLRARRSTRTRFNAEGIELVTLEALSHAFAM